MKKQTLLNIKINNIICSKKIMFINLTIVSVL